MAHGEDQTQYTRKLTSGTTLITIKLVKVTHNTYSIFIRGDSRRVMAKVVDCTIIGNEFDFSLCHYIHFQTNILRININAIPTSYSGWCPRGVIVKAMDCGIVVSEFELQSRYYVHFRANTLGKGMSPPYPPSYGLNSTTTVLLEE